MKRIAALALENTMVIPLKMFKIELTYDPVRLLLGVYLKEMKTGAEKDICTPCSALFVVTKKQYYVVYSYSYSLSISRTVIILQSEAYTH